MQDGQKIQHVGGKAGVGVHPAVVLLPDVVVREVRDGHGQGIDPWGSTDPSVKDTEFAPRAKYRRFDTYSSFPELH